MLPSAEMVELRNQAEAAFDTTCTIQTYTETNTKGSVVKAWANTYTAVDCRLAALKRGKEYAMGQGLVSVAQYVLTLASGQAIDPKDRVIVGGDTYDVLHVEDDQSYRTARRAYLAKS